MDTWIWIVIAVVVVVAALFVVGLVLSKRRQVSLTERTETPTVEKDTKPRGGGYKAGGSISFSSGGTALEDRPSGPKPAEPAAPKPEPSERATPEPATPAATSPEPPAPGAAAPATTEPDEVRPAEDSAAAESSAPAAPAPSAPTPAQPGDTVESDVTPVSDQAEPGVAEPAIAEPDAAEPEAVAPSGAEPAVAEPADTAAGSGVTDVPVVAESATAEPATAEPGAEPTTGESAAPVVVPETPAAPISAEPGAGAADEIAPAEGRLNRLRGRLARSQNAFGRSMLGLLGAGNLDEDSWMDVEDTLLLADLGAQASTEIAEKLRDEVAANGVADAAAARALLRRVLVEAVDPTMDRSIRALPHDGRPAVLLVVGVNGTGKTTTTGKLARVLVAQGRDVVLGAADTFRAAAADQLATWAERAGATVVRAKEGTDPASVAFDSVKAGVEGGADAVLIDTAGRLHTKTGLMDELGKVKRVVEKQSQVDEILLVLDATTGQNGLVQARVFAEVVDITGIVLTKLDGTAKGGIVVAVQRALGVPVKLVGLGEGPDDLAPFEAEAFVDALLGD